MQQVFKIQDVKFAFPTTISVCGPTSCGKTFWVYKFMKNLAFLGRDGDKTPEKILYCYSIDQPLYTSMREELPGIVFYKGLPSLEYIYEFADEKAALIILDDLVQEIIENNDMLLLFTQGSHHKNISVVFMTQNLFQ